MNAKRHYKPSPINPRQIKAIHTAIGKKGIDQGDYWTMLRSYGCKDRDCGDKKGPHPTSKDLTWRQAEELLDQLNGKNTPPSPPCKTGGVPKAGGSGLRRGLPYADMDNRPGFATGAQCRLIAAMFAQVTRAEDPEAEEKALNSFCTRIVQVAGLRMVRGWQVEKVIKALESMGAVKKGA